MHGFPLAAGPKDVPDAVDDGAIRDPGTATTLVLLGFGKDVLDLAPDRSGELEVVDP